MYSRILIAAIATAIALPVAAHAQSDAPEMTRAQVRAELVQLERAGYEPARVDNAHYPEGLLAGEARIRTAGGTESHAINAVGGATGDRSASGIRAGAMGSQTALFAHH